jgi:uncharacterized protein (DUF1778 family)
VTRCRDKLIARATQRADIARIERRRVTIPSKHWNRFEEWMRKPAREVPALKELAERPPTWLKSRSAEVK